MKMVIPQQHAFNSAAKYIIPQQNTYCGLEWEDLPGGQDPYIAHVDGEN
jgi:hypothetical protein